MLMMIAWVSGYDFSGQISENEMGEFPHLLKWIDRIAEVSLEKFKNEVLLIGIASCRQERNCKVVAELVTIIANTEGRLL
jgi:hypothetical protein